MGSLFKPLSAGCVRGVGAGFKMVGSGIELGAALHSGCA